jgi:hypothetical protein
VHAAAGKCIEDKHKAHGRQRAVGSLYVVYKMRSSVRTLTHAKVLRSSVRTLTHPAEWS